MGAFFGIFDWQHSVLLGGATLGGILVGLGILKESEEWSAAALMVLIGVIIEPIFTIGLFVYDEHLSHEQNEIIAGQNREIIALRKKLAPRELTKDQLADLSKAAKQFPGQQYWLSVAPGSESAAFMCSIKAALNEAGWIRIQDLGIALRMPTCDDNEQIGINFMSDVHVRINIDAPESTQKAQAALVGALKADEIDAFAHKGPHEMEDKYKTAIHIMIGAKL